MPSPAAVSVLADASTVGLKDRATIVSTLDDSELCPKDQFASIADPPSISTSSQEVPTTSSSEESTSNTETASTNLDDATTSSSKVNHWFGCGVAS